LVNIKILKKSVDENNKKLDDNNKVKLPENLFFAEATYFFVMQKEK
jgi:hypothetical protein